MTNAAAPDPSSSLAGTLAAGLASLSSAATVTFTQYTRRVLPLDGYVFWVRTDLATGASAPTTVTVAGSIHYAIDKRQNEDETVSVNSVVFTATSEVNDLDAIGPQTMFLAEIGPESIPFCFSSRGRFFAQSNLYHYSGDAVYPAMRSLIIDDVESLASLDLIASDSLPIWLMLNCYRPPYPGFVSPVTLYPSFAVPENLAPPYGSVHIEPSSIMGRTAAPVLGPTLSRAQPVTERVRVTLYGLDNATAGTFLDTVLQYSYDYSTIGLANMPAIRDEKRTQRELGILAMKKTIEFDVNYLQTTARAVARQLIATTVQAYSPQDFIPATP